METFIIIVAKSSISFSSVVGFSSPAPPSSFSSPILFFFPQGRALGLSSQKAYLPLLRRICNLLPRYTNHEVNLMSSPLARKTIKIVLWSFRPVGQGGMAAKVAHGKGRRGKGADPYPNYWVPGARLTLKEGRGRFTWDV